MNKISAIERIISSHRKSGYAPYKSRRAILHLDKHGITKERVSLLARGYSENQTEFLIKEGVHHHYDLNESKLEEYQSLFGKY